MTTTQHRQRATKRAGRAPVVFGLLLLLAGCEPGEEFRTDQCLRRELFAECMKLLPSGPEKTRYSDWDEVVDACADNAMWTARRQVKNIKPECR